MSLYNPSVVLMAVVCGAAGNETRLIMWKITPAQPLSCQAIRQSRRLSMQFKRLRDNWKQQWHFRDHDQSRANWTAGFSSLYRMLCEVLMCPRRGGKRQFRKIYHNTHADYLLVHTLIIPLCTHKYMSIKTSIRFLLWTIHLHTTSHLLKVRSGR